MNHKAVINIAKSQLGLDEETYRAMLERVTGKSSLRAMTESDLAKVVGHLKSKGFKPARKKGPYSHKPYVRKIFALWKSVNGLGEIADGSRTALRAFVRNKTGKDDPEFLTYDEAGPVIEALKAMEVRGQKKVKERGGLLL